MPDDADLAVDAHAAGGDRRRGRRPADVGQQRDDAVEALAGQRRRHRLGDHRSGDVVLVGDGLPVAGTTHRRR